MNPNLVAILSFSIAIAGIIGCVRFKKIDPAYYSFLFFVWLGLVNEIVSFILISVIHSNVVNSNIYVLLESMLLVWFFRTQALSEKPKKIFNWLFVIFILGWTFENFFMSSIHQFNSYFTVIYCFTTVLMSINLVNRLISNEKKLILRNPAFLICVCFILFFTCKALIEIFWIYGLNASKEFRIQVYDIMTFVNLIVNLIFALAVLWMPRKREYTLL